MTEHELTVEGTIEIYEAAPVMRRPRKVDSSPIPRIHCVGCGKTIPPRAEFVTGKDGFKYHLFCAADAGQIEACTDCFLIHGGECDR